MMVDRDVEMARYRLHRSLLELALGEPQTAATSYAAASRFPGCSERCALDQSGWPISRAQYWALRGDQEQALQHVRWLASSPAPTVWTWENPDFSTLRGNPAFEALRLRSREAMGL